MSATVFIGLFCSTLISGLGQVPGATAHESYVRPPAPAAAQRADERAAMVRHLQRIGHGDHVVRDRRVLAAMRAVPRHAFVPAQVQHLAYADTPLPIGHEQTISQPFIVAWMTQELRVTPASKILEIGTGSAYQAAVLAELTPHVYTIEIVEPLGRRAARTLKEQGYTAVHTRIGDGYKGWPEAAPFAGIIVTCAADKLPPPLWDQLKPGGRIVIPIGKVDEVQRLYLIEKNMQGQRVDHMLSSVRFVPLTRDATGRVTP